LRAHASPTSTCHTTGCAPAAAVRFCSHRRGSLSAHHCECTIRCASAAAARLCSQVRGRAPLPTAEGRDACAAAACRTGYFCDWWCLPGCRLSAVTCMCGHRSRLVCALCCLALLISTSCCTISALSDGFERRGCLLFCVDTYCRKRPHARH